MHNAHEVYKCLVLILKFWTFQLQMAQDEETKDKVEIVAILSMSSKEIEENIQMV